MADGDKKAGFCPIMSLRSSFSKEAMVPCITDKCAFWDEAYIKCGYITQGERTADALSLLRQELHSLVIKS